MSTRSPVLVATDLTPASEPALERAHAHARATGAPLLVCHIIPDVLRHHPLLPTPGGSDAVASSDLTKKVADMTSEQVGRVLRIAADEYTVAIETGDAEDEIVRLAEEHVAQLIVVGAAVREGMERALGHVAERVVRYAHTPVLVARAHSRTNKILVATDFTPLSAPALELAGRLVKAAQVDATLVHVMQLPNAALAIASSPLGSAWTPPTQDVVNQLDALGKSTLEGLAKQYGFAHFEQLSGEPGAEIVARAEALDVEMIVLSSHGRTGLARLVLGSTAERVVRGSRCSVLITRAKAE